MKNYENALNLELERMKAMTAAEELGYGFDVISKIRNARTEFEMSRILTSARKTSR